MYCWNTYLLQTQCSFLVTAEKKKGTTFSFYNFPDAQISSENNHYQPESSTTAKYEPHDHT